MIGTPESIDWLQEQAMSALYNREWNKALSFITEIRDIEIKAQIQEAFVKKDEDPDQPVFDLESEQKQMVILTRNKGFHGNVKYFPITPLIRKSTFKAVGIVKGEGPNCLQYIAKSLLIKYGEDYFAPEWVLKEGKYFDMLDLSNVKTTIIPV